MKEINSIQAADKTSLTDAAVVDRILTGENALYELLMRRHNQKLYRVIRSYLKEEQEVEDTMQDTYLKAFEKLHQFRQDALFSTWLIRIGINNALAKLRERNRLSPVSLLADQHEDYAFLLTQSNLIGLVNHRNPEKIAIQNEIRLLLEKAIDSIPEKYRTVYTLCEVEGMPVDEVTQCLNLSESNVRVRLHRAKAMLKEVLFNLSLNQEVFEFGDKRCDALVEWVLKALPSDS
ncbi:RNA polymerase sigma factor [Pontibacter sp. BT731]|uniref:RNA polymerase sigma factor n=1 Tax=Pontibacter coccineus TaxID=3063328 RepID=UPI0026E1420A|nr:RNA polymerase sigma factor [Pontibacter sp. BT731]MDO6388520.1 RNA polymerase sigma factor [Pontibacter sp. BT731]